MVIKDETFQINTTLNFNPLLNLVPASHLRSREQIQQQTIDQKETKI